MTLIASHRGGTHLWPENSRLAFRETARLPVELVEFDVHQTRDGVLVVHHDSTIDRMTDGRGPIAGFDHAELMKHVIIGAGGETIPTLDEVIAIFKPSSVDLRLEIKTAPDGRPYVGMERAIVAALAGQDMLGRSMITSFALERLQAFRVSLEEQGLDDGALKGLVWLCSPVIIQQCGWTGVIAALSAYGVTEVALRADTVTPECLSTLRDAGLVVHAWAAHSQAAASAMFTLGLASFTTDRPDLAIRARSSAEM